MQKKPDPSIFYSLACINQSLENSLSSSNWGAFIDPLKSSANYVFDLKRPGIYAEKIDFSPYLHKNVLFDFIVNKIQPHISHIKKHRLSAKYYFDFLDLLARHVGNVNRVVEIGPQHSDISYLFSAALIELNIDLDIVDIDENNLLHIYRNIVTFFPEAASKIRLFLGDLPTYIKNVSLKSDSINLIHYQASSNFNDLIRDLGATSYSKNKIYGSIVTNTNLRSTDMRSYVFSDIALYALFGSQLQFFNLGEIQQTSIPSQSQYYIEPNKTEALYIPYQVNQFRYPHPHFDLESFLYKTEGNEECIK